MPAWSGAQDLLADSNPMVVANAVAALADIRDTSASNVFTLSSQSLFKLLRALNECTEWGQVRCSPPPLHTQAWTGCSACAPNACISSRLQSTAVGSAEPCSPRHRCGTDAACTGVSRRAGRRPCGACLASFPEGVSWQVHALSREGLCAWWCTMQVYILDAIAKMPVQEAKDAESIVERVVPRLQHANSAVVLSAVKVRPPGWEQCAPCPVSC